MPNQTRLSIKQIENTLRIKQTLYFCFFMVFFFGLAYCFTPLSRCINPHSVSSTVVRPLKATFLLNNHKKECDIRSVYTVFNPNEEEMLKHKPIGTNLTLYLDKDIEDNYICFDTNGCNIVNYGITLLVISSAMTLGLCCLSNENQPFWISEEDYDRLFKYYKTVDKLEEQFRRRVSDLDCESV